MFLNATVFLIDSGADNTAMYQLRGSKFYLAILVAIWVPSPALGCNDWVSQNLLLVFRYQRYNTLVTYVCRSHPSSTSRPRARLEFLPCIHDAARVLDLHRTCHCIADLKLRTTFSPGVTLARSQGWRLLQVNYSR